MIFDGYVGIDYSRARTPDQSLKGLRAYRSDHGSEPTEVLPPPSPRSYWTRREIAAWLIEQLRSDRRLLIGIDHGFSFPMNYFRQCGLSGDWQEFLDDFQRHWPTDGEHTYVSFVREGLRGNGAVRSGNPRWRRLVEVRTGTAKSVFHFDVPGSVATSTHAGLPWLRTIRQEAAGKVHFWPFDGWDGPDRKSVIAEVYPSLWSGSMSREDRTADQHDAYSVAAWMRAADSGGQLEAFFRPTLTDQERSVASVEGWILGVM